MNILYIVPYVPTPIRVRPYSLIHCLARHGHRVILATVWESDREKASLSQFEEAGIRVLAEPLKRARRVLNTAQTIARADTPLQSAYSWQPGLASRIRSVISDEPLDVIHVEHLRGAKYALLAQSHRQLGAVNRTTPVVWDAVDCITYLFRQTASKSQRLLSRLMARFEFGRTERLETRLVHQFDRVLVTSDIDKRELMKLAAAGSDAAPASPIVVVTNGVDLEYFRPDDRPPQPDTLVFSGKMSYHANATAALYLLEQVMPLVWQSRDHVQLTIAGSQPSARIRRLGERSAGRVHITGYVPDIRPFLWDACLSVAPMLYGAGIQNKVLETFACARPVVATSRAMAPMGCGSADAGLVADTPHELAQAIVRLLGDPELRARMGAAGRCYVEQQHDWDDITRRLESTYLEAIGTQP